MASFTTPYRVGIEWTNEIDSQDLLNHLNRMSCLELIPENFFDNRRRDFLDALARSGMPVLIHSVEVSFGTAEPLKEEHFERVLEVAGRVNTANLSDHLCMTEAGGVEIGQLTPIPWTKECANAVCRNIDAIQSRLKCPFLLENISNRFLIPNTEMSETEFINYILDKTGCGMLIDLNNIHTNATNFGFDPRAWIDSISLDSVKAVHLAGGYVDEDGVLIDSHDHAVPDSVWELFRHLCARITPEDTIVEWTADPPPMEKLILEVEKAELILEESLVRSNRLTRPALAELGGAR